MRIAIIGTGVAGSLLAHKLSGHHDVTAFERAQPNDRNDAGTGLNIGPNALKALRLGAPDLHAAIRAGSLPWQTWQVSLADGTRLLEMDLETLAEEPGARLRWADLYHILRAPIAARTQAGHSLQAIEEDPSGRLIPVFETASGLQRRGAFDLVVAADGRYSRTRAIVAGEPAVELQGVCMWRLLVPDGTTCPFDDFGQWFNGPNRLLAYKLPRGAVYIAGAFALHGDGTIPAASQTPAAQRALFTPRQSSACPAVAWMLDRIDDHFDQIHWARSQTTRTLRTACSDRVLLLGDAAHAMVPTLGQGATQAIEDAIIAATVLGHGGTPAEIAALRATRVAFVRQFSIEASDTLLPGSDPVSGTRAKAEPAFQAKLRRLWTEIPGLVPGDLVAGQPG